MLTSDSCNDLAELLSEIKNLREMNEKLSKSIECSFDGIYITDGDANTIMVNESYESITGLKRDKLIGRNMRDLVNDKTVSLSGTISCIEQNKTVTLEQTFITEKKALITSRPIFDEEGKIILVVTNVRDITELNALKEKLIREEELAKKYQEEIAAVKKQLLYSDLIVAIDGKSIDILCVAKRIAKAGVSVLIQGETGVGKEEIAHFIHQNSDRADKSFISVNCGSIPENLMESELFGYEPGAFSGSSPDGKKGLFEMAEGGSIFLDEVGELSMTMQVKLLRFLQEKEFKKIGGVKSVKVDVRIISATNRILEGMVKEGTFRRDLYYRLNVVPMYISPLRDRRDDILPLVQKFLQKYNKKYNVSKFFSREALDALYNYDWPGNVRELKNLVERLIIITPEDFINKNNLGLPDAKTGGLNQLVISEESDTFSLKEAVERLEYSHIKNAYEKRKNVRDAASYLLMDASTFVRKRKKYSQKYD